jgi:hypothetical protein
VYLIDWRYRGTKVSCRTGADVAQLVEHSHGKREVSGSIPDVGL